MTRRDFLKRFTLFLFALPFIKWMKSSVFPREAMYYEKLAG